MTTQSYSSVGALQSGAYRTSKLYVAALTSSTSLSLRASCSQQMLVCVYCRAATPRFRLSSLKLPVRSSLANQASYRPSTDSPLQKIHSGPNSRSLSAAVIRLRKAELVQEMQLRGLPETGSRHDLRERLLQAIQAEQRHATGGLPLLKPLLTSLLSLHNCVTKL